MNTYDVVIVGAGIHGAGAAQAAAARGYSVLVLEQEHPAFGASSRSSKLIHGGLRYLETWQWGLVREALAERALLLKLARDLVQLVPFHVPLYRHTRRGPWTVRAGLSLYALLGGVGKAARFSTVPRAQWSALDGLKLSDLRAVFRYYDAQTDDAALTRAVLRSARELGAEMLSPAKFTGAVREGGVLNVQYVVGTDTRECRAHALVNAAGAWVNRVAAAIQPQPPLCDIELVQGTHIVVPQRLAAGMFYLEAPQDARAVFVMPWRGGALVGTTETPFGGDPAAVRPLPDEIAYLQNVAMHYFPHGDWRALSSFAGLRVLPAGKGAAFGRSRETHIRLTPSGPVVASIYGGKLTTYRATGARLTAQLAPRLPARRARGDTAKLRLAPD